MTDLKNPNVIVFKGLLFIFLGVLSVSILMFRHPGIQTAILLAIAIWAFARSYYFAFYVIENYVDDEYKFAGLLSAAKYLWNRRRPLQ